MGRLGIPVFTQAASRSAPAFSSRYSRRKIVWDLYANPAEETVSFLLSVGRELARPALLIATCDVTAALLADYDTELRKYFLFPRQRAALVHQLTSKRGLHNLTKSLGIPTPDTCFPESRADVQHFLDSARFPIVLKVVKNRIDRPETYGLKIIVKDRQELLYLHDKLEDPDSPNLMIQEYIPGGEDSNWMFNGYFDDSSDCSVGFTGKKIRQSPPYAGVTSLGICARNEVVENMVKSFMKAIGYRGVLDMGCRFDARDGTYKVYDVNPRIGCTFRLFVDDNGVDVARALYSHMTGQPLCTGASREGRKWIVEDSDVRSSIQYYRHGRITMRQWIESIRGIEEGAVFALDDPMPILARLANDVRKLLVVRDSVRAYGRNGAVPAC